jgi:hypothetical protein
MFARFLGELLLLFFLAPGTLILVSVVADWLDKASTLGEAKWPHE